MKRIALLLLLLAGAGRADVFRVLDDPQDAMQARVDLIQQADHEINALYFLARNDRITLGALALLREARRRGVGSVRLIVDANFQHIPKAVLAHLRDEGVEVRVYHPLTLRHPSWMFRRMHEKVVVVDARRYITGGRNLAEAYFGLAKKNYVDRDVYVDGPSAADADQHFENLWASVHVADLDVHVSADEKRLAADKLGAALDELVQGGFVEIHSGTDWSEGEEEVGGVTFLHDPIAKGPRVASRLMDLLDDASESIVIESPYFVPPKALRRLLYRKLEAGVRVQIVTNSLRSTDGVIPQAAYFKYRGRLLRAGADIREYKGPDALHAKTIVIDGRVVLVGSYNIDPRSQNLNTEVMCVTEDEAVARAVRASIDGHLENAWAVKHLPLRERLPGVSRGMSFRAWAARFLLPLIENQI